MRVSVLLLVATACLALAASNAAARDKIERRFEVAPDVSIVVSNAFGEVRVEGWDRPEVELKAKVKGGDLDIDADRDRIDIELDLSFFRMFRGFNGKIELRVPHGAELEIDGVGTRIRVDDVNGPLRLQTIEGDIRVEGAPPTARLSTISGEIRFSGRGTSVHAQSISGDIRLDGVAGELEVQSTSGSVRVENGALRDGSIEVISGEVRIATSLLPGARLDVETLSGSIRLELPKTSSTRLSLESTSGEVRSELGDDAAHRGSRLDVDVGKGDGRVRLKSFSGEIRVEER